MSRSCQPALTAWMTKRAILGISREYMIIILFSGHCDGYDFYYVHTYTIYLILFYFTEPYDQETWGMILVVAVHSTGFFILLYDYLSPAARERYRSRSGQPSFIARTGLKC